MRITKVLVILALVTALASVAPVAALAQGAGDAAGKVYPNVLRAHAGPDPQVAGPGYGLFGCQVGLSVGQCYDPIRCGVLTTSTH